MSKLNKLYRKSEVLELFGFSHGTLFREINEGRFPAPVKVTSNISGWREDELIAHQKTLKKEMLPSPNPKVNAA